MHRKHQDQMRQQTLQNLWRSEECVRHWRTRAAPGRVRTILVPMRLVRVAVSQAIDAASSPCVQMSGIQGLGDWRGRPSFCSSGFGLCRPYWTRVLACVLHVHVWLCIPNAVDADTHLYFIHAVMSQTLARVKRNVRVQRTAQASTRFHHPSNWAV